MNHPVQLWEPELVSTIQRQQASIRAASSKQQHQLVVDQQGPPTSSNVHRHLLEPLTPLMGQELMRKSRSTDISHGDREASKTQRINQSARDSPRQLLPEDSRGQRGRISSGDATLKGHLGHLAAAVAEAHRKEVVEDKSSMATEVDKRQEAVEDKNFLTTEVNKRQKAVEGKGLLTTDVDIHFCKNCDKILSQQEEIEQHNLSCIKLS